MGWKNLIAWHKEVIRCGGDKPLMLRKYIALIALLLVAGLLIAGCSPQTQDDEIAPMGEMPSEVRSAPRVVSEAYRFAAAHPDVLTELPCYCGCGSMGHSSNYACYVASENADGLLTFDNHALGCSICVDITQDAMRMLADGYLLPEIRAYVDQTYSAFGPSNLP
jgi:hypothetical protein